MNAWEWLGAEQLFTREHTSMLLLNVIAACSLGDVWITGLLMMPRAEEPE
jgi:hypothetical protein